MLKKELEDILKKKKQLVKSQRTRRHSCEMKKVGLKQLEDIWNEKNAYNHIVKNQKTFGRKKKLVEHQRTRRHCCKRKKVGLKQLEDI